VSDEAVVEWLLCGDPVIRWQTMRDLLDEPAAVWQAERRRVLEAGWVAELLSRQGRDGEWPAGRWTGSVWTLLLLVACGLPEGHPPSRAPVEGLLGRFSAQLDDGGWNCHMRNHPHTHHSSFHTTFNVLENLRLAVGRGAVTSPWHWHYTVLRGLDYLRLTPAIHDPRLDDPIGLLCDQRKPNGRWSLQKRIPGTLLVEMERPGGESRWNTLRALRILRCRAR
jgi:hypothetical protein